MDRYSKDILFHLPAKSIFKSIPYDNHTSQGLRGQSDEKSLQPFYGNQYISWMILQIPAVHEEHETYSQAYRHSMLSSPITAFLSMPHGSHIFCISADSCYTEYDLFTIDVSGVSLEAKYRFN